MAPSTSPKTGKASASSKTRTSKKTSAANAKLTQKQMVALFRSIASDMMPEANAKTIAEVKVMRADGNHDWLFMTAGDSENGGEGTMNVSRFVGPAAMLPTLMRRQAKSRRSNASAASQNEGDEEMEEDVVEEEEERKPPTPSTSRARKSSTPASASSRRRGPPRAARRNATPGVSDLADGLGRFGFSNDDYEAMSDAESDATHVENVAA